MTQHESSQDGTDAPNRTNETHAANESSAERRGRHISRRRLLAAGSAAAAIGVAGCLGGDGGGDGNSSDGDSSADDSTSDGGSVGGPGNSARSEVDGLDVTGASSEVSQGSYQITLTVENTGGEDTGILDYSYDATFYDGDGSEVSHSGVSAANEDGFFDDDTGRVRIEPYQPEPGPEAIESYEVRIVCDGFSDGVYCEG